MSFVANALVVLVAVLHLGFLVLEMFLWETPRGHKIFRNSPDKAAMTAVLAKNQGLYNGFLAAGLAWGLFRGSVEIKSFFLGCVVIAGLYGAATASRSILFMQALPAALALTATLLFAA